MNSTGKRLRRKDTPNLNQERQHRRERGRFKAAQAKLRAQLGGMPLVGEDPFDWIVSDFGDEPNTHRIRR